VGFGFAALENLCGHRRRYQSDPTACGRMRGTYADVWNDVCGADVVHQATAVAPVVRYAMLAMRSAGWLWGRPTPAAREPFLRSLTRSLWRAASASDP
jgi:hypothetical protein